MGATTLTRLFNACSHATLRRGSVFIIGGDMHTLAYRTSDTTFSTDIRSRRRGGGGKRTLGLCMTFISTVLHYSEGSTLVCYVFLKYMCVRVILRFDPFDEILNLYIHEGVATTRARRTSRTFKKKTFFPPRSWRRFHVGDGFARIRLV